jgi:hypothetical protein
MNLTKCFSADMREEGNKIFKSINDMLSPCDKETRLLKCLNLYQKAVDSADDMKSKASALKNHAVASFHLFKYSYISSFE